MLLPRGSLVTRFSSHPMHTVAGTTPSTQSGVLHPVRVLPERDLKLPRGGGVPGQAALSALRCARWSRAFLGRGSRNAAPCSSRTWSLWETPPLGPLPSLLTQKVGGPEGSTPHVPPPEVPMHTRAGEAGARAGAGSLDSGPNVAVNTVLRDRQCRSLAPVVVLRATGRLHVQGNPPTRSTPQAPREVRLWLPGPHLPLELGGLGGLSRSRSAGSSRQARSRGPAGTLATARHPGRRQAGPAGSRCGCCEVPRSESHA